MAIKELKTRIALKYDSYTNWNDTTVEGKGGNLVLLPGEIGICEISAVQDGVSNVVPTVLFKVGGSKYPDTEANQQLNRVGKLMAFKDLPWASAKAADVYSWAKADSVVFDATSKTIQFKAGDAVVHSIDLSHFAAASTVADHTTSIADFSTRIAAIESSIGLGDGTEEGSVASQIADILEELGKITGADDVEGSIAKALKDAKAYADAAQTAAETAAKGYTDGEVATLNAKDAELVAEDARLAGLIAAEVEDRAEAIEAIEDKIGEVAADTTVVDLIAAAQTAADNAQADVDALTAEDGVITANTAAIEANAANIADNAQAIAGNTQAIADEASARAEADTGLSNRLTTVEDEINYFFKDALKDSNTEGNVQQALDTLVEIQNYLNGEGEAAGGIIGRVATNEEDIKGLKATTADHTANITTLQELTAGYTGAQAIKNAIDEAAAKGQLGITDAAAAKAAADAADAKAQTAQDEVNALELVVADVKTTADTAASDLAALTTRVGTAETDIDNLEAIVKTGNDTNAKLREAITALESTVNTGTNNNGALRSEIDRVAGLVDDTATGLAATKGIADYAKSTADDNAGRLAAIEADYLKAADMYIFDCGSASLVIHTEDAAEA